MDIKFIAAGKISPDKLKEDKDNPNKMTQQQYAALLESGKTYGQLQPVVIDQTDTIIDGMHRTRMCKELGMDVNFWRINCRPQDRRIIRQILNKLKGRHDPQLDAEEFIKILKDSGEKKLFETSAIREGEFYKTIAMHKDQEKKDESSIPLPPAAPITRRGDIWKLGSHYLMCGDSCDPKDVAKLMGGVKAHVVVTDPPYGVDYVESIKGREGTNDKWMNIKGDELKGKALQEFCRKFLANIKAHTTGDSAYYIFFGMKTFHHLLAAMDEEKIYYALPLIWIKGRPTISWAKYHPDYEVIAYGGSGAKGTRFRAQSEMKKQGIRGGAGAGNYTNSYEPIAFGGEGAKPRQPRWYAKYDQTTTWMEKPDNSASYEHPTTKPVSLAERALLNSSQEGEVVLDLFTGSGFTLIAAHKLKRIFYGMELEPIYVDVSVLRWEGYSGLKAVRIPAKPEKPPASPIKPRKHPQE